MDFSHIPPGGGSAARKYGNPCSRVILRDPADVRRSYLSFLLTVNERMKVIFLDTSKFVIIKSNGVYFLLFLRKET